MDDRRRCVARAFAIALALTSSTNALADVTFTVNTVDDRVDDDTGDGLCHTSVGTCSLRAAIMQANTLTVPVTRISIPTGNFVLVRPPAGGPGVDANGDLDFKSPLVSGQRIVVTGAGATLTIIDANQIDRVLSIATNRSVEITGVTFRNGNSHTSAGGGLFNLGTLRLDRCVVESNQTLSSGGGMLSAGALLIERSTFQSNTSTSGGGLLVSAGPSTIRDSTFRHNRAISPSDGGFGTGSGGAVTVLFNPSQNATLSAINSTFSQNIADRNGGAIESGGPTFLYSSTVVGNDADHDRDETGGIGGGVYVASATRFVITNTLVANNTILDAPITDNCHGVVEAYGWNLLDEEGGCTFTGNGTAARGFVSSATIGPLQDNGGPTLTHALLASSEAINSTTTQGCIDNTGALLDTDQRGAARIAGFRCDVGAFEYGAAVDTIFNSGFE